MSYVEELQERGVLKTSRVIEAMTVVPRIDFLPPETKADHEKPHPVHILKHPAVNTATVNNSAPIIFAKALEAMNITPGDICLDIGFGSFPVEVLTIC